MQYLVKGFVGRRKELREYIGQLRDADPPSLCITGAGGIGKSTLASLITDKLNHDGFIVVPLFGEMTLDIFIHEVQKSLMSAKEKEHIDYLKSLSDNNDKFSYILSNIMASCQLIFLFDNFEDNLKQSEEFKIFKNEYWEESFKTLVGHLPHTGSKVLITCRYSLPGMSESLMKQIQLKELSFAEILKIMVYSSDFNEVTLNQAKEIYDVLGGNPKALVDLREILSKSSLKWEEIKIKLEKIALDMREFQLFEILYSFLNTGEKAFFRRISVFRKAVGLDGLRRQISKEEILDKYLKTLYDYGILQEFKDDGILLYQVHPLNRGFVKDEWWEKDEKEKAHDVAAQHYLDQKDFSIESLIEVAYHFQLAQLYNKMAYEITNYNFRLNKWGYWDECLYLNISILELGERVDVKFISLAYCYIGQIYSNKGRWDKALEYFLNLETIFMEVGSKIDIALNYNNIGSIYSNQGEWDKAMEYFLNSESIIMEIGNKACLGPTYNNIGLIYSRRGEWDKALVFFLKSESIYQEVGNKVNIEITYNNIGTIYSNKGEWDIAMEYFLKSESIQNEVGDKVGLGVTCSNIGGIYSNKGEWDKAMEYYLKSEMIQKEVGDKAGLVSTYNNIGTIYNKKGDLNNALEYYLKSITILKDLGGKVGLGTIYNNIGQIYSNKGELENALEYYLKSEAIRKEACDKAGLGITYNNIGLLFFSKGEWNKCIMYYMKSEAIYKEVGDIANLAQTYFNIGTGLVKNGDCKRGNDYIILAGVIAIKKEMKVVFNQMIWAIEPLIKELGPEKFMAEGKRLYEQIVLPAMMK